MCSHIVSVKVTTKDSPSRFAKPGSLIIIKETPGKYGTWVPGVLAAFTLIQNT